MERDFKGIWIPKEIWLNTDLSPLEKIILAEIDSLDTEEYDGCIAGNEYLAEFCQCSINKVATAVSKLKEMGFVELVSFDGRTRRLKSRLNKNQEQTFKKTKADFGKENTINIANKIKDKIKDNDYNNESLQGVNKVDRVKNNRFVPPTIEEIKMFCNERNNGVDAKRVFDYYSSANWKDGRGNPVKNWKQKIIAVWEKNNEKPVGHVAHGNDDYDDDFDMERYIKERRKRG